MFLLVSSPGTLVAPRRASGWVSARHGRGGAHGRDRLVGGAVRRGVGAAALVIRDRRPLACGADVYLRCRPPSPRGCSSTFHITRIDKQLGNQMNECSTVTIHQHELI